MKKFEKGSIWLKGDLHLHSPLVHSFTLPSGVNLNDNNILIDAYINKLIENQIDFAAITDYQQIRIEWFKNFQKKANEKGIVIFPGIELSITYGKGVHILLIFEQNENLEGINNYIISLDKNPQDALINSDRSHRDIDPKENLKTILSEIKQKFNCLIIFAHPKDKNGFLDAFQLREAAECIKLADACEFFNEQEKNRLISTGLVNNHFFENFAFIENSDPKNLNEIGAKQRNNKLRTTYYKLSEISIHALKIAFQEPKIRINLYEKPEYEFDRIDKITISGTKFLKDVELNFNKELNCLIGGRGVGKSATIESIRYCLKTPYYSEQSIREDFVTNVIGSGGKITLEVSRVVGDKIQQFTIERIVGKEPEVKGYQSSPSEIFEENIPIIIGQKELYHLTNDKNYLLQLVDQLIGDEVKKKEAELKENIFLLDENGKKYLNIIAKLKNKENDEQRLKNLEDNLKIFQDLGVVEKMKEAANLIKDENLLKNKLKEIQEKITALEDAYNELTYSLKSSIETLKNGISKEKSFLLDVSSKLNSFLNSIENQNLIKIIKNFDVPEILHRWNHRKVNYEKEINEIKKELSARNIDANKYESYIREKESINNKINEYKKLEQELEKLKEQRNELKIQLAQARYKLFEIRKLKLDDLNNKLGQKLKISVAYQANRDKFENCFRNLLRGSNVQTTAIDNIIHNDKINVDGIELSKILEKGQNALKENFNLTDAMASRIYDWFKDKEKLFELEKMFPDDKITIELKVDDEYKEFEKLSAGQKATALLILLFSDEKKILIIDQPEEDLDNRFIYEDVVKFILNLKRKRQLIFATHNANIPVLGEAEQVFVLESDNQLGCLIKAKGSIDKQSIIDHIKSIMEGGEEAFKRRINKYEKK